MLKSGKKLHPAIVSFRSTRRARAAAPPQGRFEPNFTNAAVRPNGSSAQEVSFAKSGATDCVWDVTGPERLWEDRLDTASAACISHIRYVCKVYCSILRYGASCRVLGIVQATDFALSNRPTVSEIWMNDSLRALFLRLFAKSRETRLDRAENRLTAAAERFRLAAEASSGSQARLLWRLAGATADLQAQLRADPKAVNELKRLVLIHVPEMALIADKWAARAQKDPLGPPDKAMKEDFEHYLRVIEEAVAVCVSGRYGDLRRANAVLDEIIQRHRT